MTNYVAPTASMVLANVTDPMVAPLIQKIAEFADRLEILDEQITDAEKSAVSKKDALALWQEINPEGLELYYALLEKAKEMYREFYNAVYAEQLTDTDAMVAEAKEIHLQCLRLAKTLEETFQMNGFVNALYNVIAKPDGSGIRSQYKGYGGYVEKEKDD